MAFYQAQDNSLHFLDSTEFEFLLPQGCVQITDEEANAITAAAQATIPGPSIQDQIDTLEREQMLPRITREFMLLQFMNVALAQGIDPMTNDAFRKLKEFNDTITALRAKL